MHTIPEGRLFLKGDLWDLWDDLQLDQREGVPHPPVQKTYPKSARLVALTSPEDFQLGRLSVYEAIKKRQSQRTYNSEPLSLEELSYLLWATQGIQRISAEGEITFRTVPSAGARHPFETYLFANHVIGLESGIYRYLAIEHKLLPLKFSPELVEDVHEGSNQQYVHESAVVFIWTAIPYRTEWRYGPLAHKMIAQDSGHLCQNLYLACESIGVGTCAIGAYNQAVMDRILEIDGFEEFTIYLATVGKINS